MKQIHGKQICESLDEVVAPDSCAVLVVDIQNDYVLPVGKMARAGNDVSALMRVLPRCQNFIETARALRVRVVHIRTITLPSGQSDSPAWIRAKELVSGSQEFTLEGTWGAEICDECAPLPGESVITKHRSSGFQGTDLDLVLRANGVRTVVVIGYQTPGCVEATFRDAAYYDYYNVLVEDCVAAYDPELHEASLKVQRARHDVCCAERVVGVWRRARDCGPVGEPSREVT
jgi:biuret amidohydrolase